MKKLQIKAGIVKNAQVQGRYFKMTLAAWAIAREAKPGQFINVKVSDTQEPLLRRPLGIHGITGGLEILYEVVGEGTAILSQRKPGESLDIVGPLGNGFDYRPEAKSQKPQILVAGGMGVAPLLFLAEKLKHRKLLVLIGAKTKSQILCAGEFKKLGCAVKIATDDGSRSFKGKVTDLLKRELSAIRYPLSAIYACGPRPMLKEISHLSKKYNIPARISLEEHMACGIGACLGCAVKTKEGFKRVCKDGPVFNAEEIIW